jgi:hypothetical protein
MLLDAIKADSAAKHSAKKRCNWHSGCAIANNICMEVYVEHEQ